MKVYQGDSVYGHPVFTVKNGKVYQGDSGIRKTRLFNEINAKTVI